MLDGRLEQGVSWILELEDRHRNVTQWRCCGELTGVKPVLGALCHTPVAVISCIGRRRIPHFVMLSGTIGNRGTG